MLFNKFLVNNSLRSSVQLNNSTRSLKHIGELVALVIVQNKTLMQGNTVLEDVTNRNEELIIFNILGYSLIIKIG